MVSTVLLDVVNFVGLAAFALSGALMAVRRQFDVIGMAVLATITTFGGGVIRDVLIGDTPPEALRNVWWLVVPLAATAVAFFFHPQITRLRRAVVVFDAIGLGVFAVNGSAKAMQWGLSPLAAVMLGVVTGIGGGILRDVLGGETPAVLRRDSQLYAIPAILGCTITVTLLALDVHLLAATLPAAAFITGVRLLAVWRRWTGPVPRALHG
ncbi:trimeric intracellular cation channel family protein [Nakamurella sp. YIM 132087]|uniref:Trimeric intracellular cation channel family protein n=1 Tax=Nakamurella alba TaxID=2665158 RepID=A0A7K1FI66_9ACTN|nr:trimeric intracellular cation channel family protein [Nakamurella alba]MTD13788.1 trimeric intracellular cation channel family protein [Nakamurella alba]